MRTITVPAAVLARATHGPYDGRALVFTVHVDWPELQLTEAQVLENAFARAAGLDTPHLDRSIFAIEVPYAVPA